MSSQRQPSPYTAAIAGALSTARLTPYLSATAGNVKNALRLYRWNVELSAAAYQALHLFEVVLRNAIDQQLCAWNATQAAPGAAGMPGPGRKHRPDWLLDPSHLLARLVQERNITEAKRRATRALRAQRRQVEHGDVLAQLSMGTWRFLLPDADPGRQRLWTDALCHAFPHLTRPVAQLVDDVELIYRLRNRVAHLEPLLRPGDVQLQYEAILRVLAEIEPATEQWLVSQQQVTPVLARRPA